MFSKDEYIVRGLLQHDEGMTCDFFYRACYPLFKSVFDNFHTDCISCKEFINEIYLHIMTPEKESGICKLEKFRFESTLFTWLKTVSLFYCYRKYKRKKNVPADEINDFSDSISVRFPIESESIDNIDSIFNRHDMDVILKLMPNKRYSQLIKLKYIEGLSNEETALKLGMNMNNFYNKHKMARNQFIKILKQDDR